MINGQGVAGGAAAEEPKSPTSSELDDMGRKFRCICTVPPVFALHRAPQVCNGVLLAEPSFERITAQPDLLYYTLAQGQVVPEVARGWFLCLVCGACLQPVAGLSLSPEPDTTRPSQRGWCMWLMLCTVEHRSKPKGCQERSIASTSSGERTTLGSLERLPGS